MTLLQGGHGREPVHVPQLRVLLVGGGVPVRGKAVQVDPIKPALKALGSERLKLKCDDLRSNFAFKFDLRRYIVEAEVEVVDTAPPIIYLAGPEHVVHEYKVVYVDDLRVCASSTIGESEAAAWDGAVADGSAPFSEVFRATDAADTAGPALSCGAWAIDKGLVLADVTLPDSDLTLYLQAGL